MERMNNTEQDILSLRINETQVFQLDKVIDRIYPVFLGCCCPEEVLNQRVIHYEADLPVGYYVHIDSNEKTSALMNISERLLDIYGIDRAQLHLIAVSNMQRDKPGQIAEMRDVLKDLLSDVTPGSDLETEELECLDISKKNTAESIYVLTSNTRVRGAACVLCPEFMDSVAEKIGTDYYLIPSSIHEFLIIMDKDPCSAEALRQMVKDVNDTQVEPEDRLSYNIYRYDYRNHQLVCV